MFGDAEIKRRTKANQWRTHINELGSKKRRRECVTDKHDKDESGSVSGDGSDRGNELDSSLGPLRRRKNEEEFKGRAQVGTR